MVGKLLADTIQADGSPRQTLTFTPQRDLTARKIVFHCTRPGARVFRITFADKPVWYSEEGLEVENVTANAERQTKDAERQMTVADGQKTDEELQEKICGAFIRGGLTIIIEISLPPDSELTVFLAMWES